MFLVKAGHLQRIWSVRFEGNTIASDQRLKTQIKSKPGILKLFINGKVDRRALLALDGGPRDSKEGYVEPRTPMEKFVAEVWGEVLGVERVGANDNFFDLGGHSLLLMKVIVRLEKKTGQRINPRELFLQTLAQVATLCEQRMAEGPTPEEPRRKTLPKKLSGIMKKVFRS